MMTTITRGAPAEPDCIGPIPIPPELVERLDARAADGEADSHPLWWCASTLASRWSGQGRELHARVIREQSGTDAAAGQAEPPPCCDVTFVLSADGRRLYLERTSAPASGPDLHAWAAEYLRLLTSAADRADGPPPW